MNVETMFAVDGSEIESTTFPATHKQFEQWMCRHPGQKTPFAQWTRPDAPAPCTKHDSDCSECGCDARYKWSYQSNYCSFEEAWIVRTLDEVGGFVFIQLESDPFIFIDGDDVRCPETGEIHPMFLEMLSELGLTYSDVSTSGSGLHAYYRGDLPADETTAEWFIDDEPWGKNDDKPAVEIYAGKHVCVTTGDHLSDTPETVSTINSDALERLVVENTDFDPVDKHKINRNKNDSRAGEKPDSDNDGDRFDSDDVADDVGECYASIKELDARDVAGKTIVQKWTNQSGDIHSFLPTWGSSSDGGTANIVDEDSWTDTGHNSGHGGPIEMALIGENELSHTEARTYDADGNEFWKGYDILRDLGFELPEKPSEADVESSDYYNIDLNTLVEGDVYSDPHSMLDACLKARDRGIVDEGVEPPTLALQAVAHEFLDRDSGIGNEVTKGQALWVYENELTVAEAGGR